MFSVPPLWPWWVKQSKNFLPHKRLTKTWEHLKLIFIWTKRMCKLMWSYNIAAAPPSLANGPIGSCSAGLPFEALVVVVVLPSNRNRHISGRSCVDGSSCNWERETEEGEEEVQEERDGWEVSHAVSAFLASFESLFLQLRRRQKRRR